ncbi:FAD-binding oxidoreductase [Amycolatopsis pithecellobii]|uniref:FAD-binding oxidoreductase n=1 Tax=Amycolatopsis pithecellobii TaxID=664692 RepID=UPI00140DB158|nr:FAD-binding oxidoreductase [Amycolatopsis pithecellobii]
MTDLTIRAFEDFPAAFKGPVLRPGDEGFAESRAIWNMRNAGHTPALIVQALDPQDVVAAVNYAREKGVPIAVRSGGHGVDAHAMPPDGLVIDTTKMKRVFVDEATGRATLEAGVLLGEMDAATQAHGLAVPAGVVSDTGVAGLALGGGIGHLSRRFGATVDSLLSIEVVTMDGAVRTVSADSEPDLFWGMRGAGHNLAIATSFTFQGHKVGPQVVSGIIVYSPEEAVKLCEGLDEAMRRTSREVSISSVFAQAPPIPGLPPELIGTPLLLAVVVYTGPVEDYEAAMGEINALATPMANMVAPKTWCETNSLLDAFQPSGRRYHSGGGYLPAMSAEVAQLVIDQVAAAPVPAGPATGCLINFPILGGALQEGDEDSCAFSRAGAAYVCEIVSMWDSEKADDEYAGWVDDSVRALAPQLTGTGYINLTADRGPDWLRTVYGSPEKWARLVQLKRKWDPDNLLAHNKNVLNAV